jgi:Pvc16 N-terminal domain
MSSYNVIREVSEAMRQILWDAYDADTVLRPIVASREAIVFHNPTETARDSSNRLSIWLYQICEDEFVKNQPAQRVNGSHAGGEDSAPAEERQFPPLALNLYYLVTPFAATREADHLLLGKSMQVMYDNAIVLLQNDDNQVFEELRIILCRLALEELTRIWEALQEPYRLSICYKVRVARVESTRIKGARRVIARTNEYLGVE